MKKNQNKTHFFIFENLNFFALKKKDIKFVYIFTSFSVTIQLFFDDAIAWKAPPINYLCESIFCPFIRRRLDVDFRSRSIYLFNNFRRQEGAETFRLTPPLKVAIFVFLSKLTETVFNGTLHVLITLQFSGSYSTHKIRWNEFKSFYPSPWVT